MAYWGGVGEFYIGTRLLVRCFGLLYFFVNLSTILEAPLLFSRAADISSGDTGALTPGTGEYTHWRHLHEQSLATAMRFRPSFLPLLPCSLEDSVWWTCCSGAVCSACLALGGEKVANVFLLLFIVISYDSVKNFGGSWFGFAWESQLYETGIHVALLVTPVTISDRFGSRGRYPFEAHVSRWILQWHTFRIMLAAGLLKIRGRDTCWQDGTCLTHHYENMPMPNPLSWYMHHLPSRFHTASQFLSIQGII